VILAIDTSTPLCRIYLIDGTTRHEYEWNAGRELADGLIGYLRERLDENNRTWKDIDGVAAYQGPGSFTGLRIGLTVLNTVADTSGIPIVGETGDDWLNKALKRLVLGDNDGLVMPLYGREPNITKPRK
jgi:tRNA threonylcarbamoyladenosine biosynthesis protein TsaB